MKKSVLCMRTFVHRRSICLGRCNLFCLCVHRSLLCVNRSLVKRSCLWMRTFTHSCSVSLGECDLFCVCVRVMQSVLYFDGAIHNQRGDEHSTPNAVYDFFLRFFLGFV